MDETDLRMDGNHVAGMLAQVFQFEMTAEWTGCSSCGDRHQLGALQAYGHGMGAVLTCPTCGQTLLRVARGGGRWWLDMRGAAWLQLDEQARLPE
jgi:Family of unknown function (DUF6510)